MPFQGRGMPTCPRQRRTRQRPRYGLNFGRNLSKRNVSVPGDAGLQRRPGRASKDGGSAVRMLLTHCF